jgi:radical SAM superfamily enzyme YgiQ (UPF0313 family)
MPEKIILIRPHNIYNYNNYPPLSLISLGSRLKSAGYDVKIINTAFEKDHLKAIGNELEGALLAGITLLTSEVPDTYNIVKFIKEHSNVPVVAGGWHCTLFTEQMASSRYIDYAVAGEGEEHLLNIADTLKNREKPEKNIFPKEMLDLDMLPLPEYDMDSNLERFITSTLTDKFPESVKKPIRWLPYESSRGCPSQCTFCINVVTNNMKYRKKSAPKVVDELEYIVKKFGINHVKMIEDNFFVDIKRARDICEGIIRKGIKITWDGESRCDYFNDRILNDETLDLCRRSGLVQLALGIESGSPDTLKIMKKGITPDQAENAVMKCNEHGIYARSSFMIEVPGETSEDIKKTIMFINRLRKYPFFTCGIGTFRPYPKCELTEGLIKDGFLKEPQNLESWIDEDIIRLYTSAEYARPWQIDGKYAEAVSYYINMESAVRLGNHQISDIIDKLKNNLFILFAKIRNRMMFYKFPIDKKIYAKFLTNFYKKLSMKDKKTGE